VERDGLARFYQLDADEQWQRRLCLDTIDDPTCRDLLERFARAKILVAVWDMTSDLSLPHFIARSSSRMPMHSVVWVRLADWAAMRGAPWRSAAP
jgi:hypothetical protein